MNRYDTFKRVLTMQILVWFILLWSYVTFLNSMRYVCGCSWLALVLWPPPVPHTRTWMFIPVTKDALVFSSTSFIVLAIMFHIMICLKLTFCLVWGRGRWHSFCFHSLAQQLQKICEIFNFHSWIVLNYFLKNLLFMELERWLTSWECSLILQRTRV